MSDSFKDIDKVILKEFDNMIDLSKIDTKINTWFDTGVYALNYICSKNIWGGIPAGRVTSIDGLASVGKSMIASSTMKSENLDYVVILETEGGGNSKELLEFSKVPLEKVRMIKASTFENYRIRKADSKIEEVSDSEIPKKKDTDKYVYVEGATRLIRKFINLIDFKKVKKNILVVLDSLGNLQSVRELSGTSDYGKRNIEIGKFFRTFDLAFERTNVGFIFTNKMYTNIGNIYDPYKASGGVNVEYNPSLSIRLWKGYEAAAHDISEKEMTEEKKRRKSALGSSIKSVRAVINKSRFGTEFREITFLIDFATGPVKFSGLFGLCKDFGLIEKAGSRYNMPGILESSFFKKDFIKIIAADEKNLIQKIQDALIVAELKIATLKESIDVSDSEEEDNKDAIVEEDEDYTDVIDAMQKDEN